MAFTSWSDLLSEFKDALANRDVDSFFLASTENRHEMRVQYTKLGNVTAFLEWLEGKASEESVTDEDGKGGILFSIGGS